MITGAVNSGQEATIALAIRGSCDRHVTFDAVIDTGFTDYLTISRSWVEQLGLRFRETMTYELADGGLAVFPLYEVQVLWDDRWRKIVASVADGGPLVGMALLHGHRLTLDAIEGGQVEIRAM